MRIGTYNVLGLTGFPEEASRPVIGPAGSAQNIAHFARVFSELDCDILALEEGVAVRAMFPIAESMKRWLATLPSPMSWPGHVLSRYAILESRVFSHANPNETTVPFSRTCGAVLVSVDAQTLLWVVVVHLHASQEPMRRQEAEILKARIVELRVVSENLIVMGDFNSETEETVHRELKAMGLINAMETAGGGVQSTTDSMGTDTRCIDHIYLSEPLAPYLQRAAIVRTPGFCQEGPQDPGDWVHSDHLPVVAELNWPAVHA